MAWALKRAIVLLLARRSPFPVGERRRKGFVLIRGGPSACRRRHGHAPDDAVDDE
jgi:hypothetical protein